LKNFLILTILSFYLIFSTKNYKRWIRSSS